ncbi:MAG: hypothetical protein HY614_05930 [Candidatus Rokubacteria bacterium]|nr:hypothetical protein [Candidatus Rokubacteria bacterium]
MTDDRPQEPGVSPEPATEPLRRLPGLTVKVITGLAGVLTAISTVYATLVSPSTDLYRLLGLAALLVSLATLGLAAWVLTARTRKRPQMGEGVLVEPAFAPGARRDALTRLVPLGAAFLILCGLGFLVSSLLSPTLRQISLLETDSEVLVLTGKSFGTRADSVRVIFPDGKDQVPTKVEPARIEVRVPDRFRSGGISVRRGPRSSAMLFFAYPGIVYDAAVVELIAPAAGGVGALMNLIEPFPGFPYYSPESDAPSQWPPRVFKDRTAFGRRVREALSGAAAEEIARWHSRTPPRLGVTGVARDDPFVWYAQLRLLLTESGGNYARVAADVGPASIRALRELETARRELALELPNRALVLRVRNEQNEDAENFAAEIQIAGAVYDVTLNAVGERARSLEWTPNRFSVDLPRLRPGYTADIQVWYYYLPLESRVFAGAAEVQWAQTEGVVVGNLGISNGRLRRSPRLLGDLRAYHRYGVDPVRGSPTFGRTRAPEPRPAPPAPRAEPARPRPREDAPAAPAAPGPHALLIASKSLGRYQERTDALEAQVRLAQAIAGFSEALAKEVAKSRGSWIYERTTPAEAEFSRFTNAYLLKGGLLAILRVEAPVDLTRLPGWEELRRTGPVHVDLVPWNQAKYEVVLHFVLDPRDARRDSKRLLTRKLALEEIFDLAPARAGTRNAIAPVFADLLRFARERIAFRYRAPATLDNVDDPTDPFYLVVRHQHVSENFYLPAPWMRIAESGESRAATDADLHARLSRLYDYAERSRELSADEFAAIFGPR